MPRREILFENGNIYHVFNKAIDSKKIFRNESLCVKFLEILSYYRSTKSKLSFSRLKNLDPKLKEEILKLTLHPTYFQINILAYCLMPNHFHLLLEQKMEKGIQRVITNLLNSFTHLVNTMENRKGPLFLSRFKAVLITSDEQLKHVSRYIHLNPFTSKVIKVKEELENYPFSSYSSYFYVKKDTLINTLKVMELFNNDKERYRKFVMDNADYQQELEYIKHVSKW